jgi:Peptidase family C25
MKRKSLHSPSPAAWPCRAVLLLLIAAPLIAIVLRGTVAAATCTGTVFAGASFVVDDATTGRGSGTASVSGCDGDITSVSVTLTFNPLPFERDLDLLLVNPNGVNNLIFFADVGNNASFTGTINVADTGAICLPLETGSGSGALIPGTTYKPTDYNGFPDDFGPGAPATKFNAGAGCPGAAGTNSFASAFSGISANGTWTLYAYDDIGPNSSNYTVNWSLTISTSTTEARVEAFTATPFSDAGIQLNWQTGYEVDNLGFNIYREHEGQRTKLNPSLIAGSALLAGPGMALTAGRSYVWWDTSRPATAGARYWLEDIDLSGQSTWHGPAILQAPAPSGRMPLQGQVQAMLLSDVGRRSAHHARTVPVERRATLSMVPTGSSAWQALPAAMPAVKLEVRREGWYRVTQPELVAAGLNPGADPRLLQLYVDGREVPIRVAGEEDGQFDPGDAIEFYGLGLDAPWSDTRVYWLVVGAQIGARIPLVSSHGEQAIGHSFPYAVERRERTAYFPFLRNGDRENFFGAVVSREPVEAPLVVEHLDDAPPGDTRLEVALQGVTAGPHRVMVSLNGASVGEVTFQGQEEGLASFSVAPSRLRAGENQVELTAQAGEQDICLVDAIRLTYWHTYAADHDALRFGATGGQRVTIGGFSSAAIRVLDITNADWVWEVTGLVQLQDAGYAVTLSVPGSGPRTLLAFTPARAQPVAAATASQPSVWRQPGHGADLLIISHRDFIDHLEPLQAHRENQGLQVVVVDVEEIFAEFSHGHKTPYALRDFLSYATTQWAPAPRFVLFIGDASLDPKNYLGLGDYDFVPTKLIDTAVMETASDDWSADFDGDGLAELAVGRLPVRTAEEVERLVARLVSYDQSSAAAGVLLVADRNDGFDFEAANDKLRELLPADVPVEEIDSGQMDIATAKSHLLESLNRGPALVNYMGHGSVDLWRGNLLTGADARALHNSPRLPVVVTMTCLNGYFHDAALESLAEALLLAEDGGAVAVWGSSGMTGPGGQALMNQELYRWLFTESSSNGALLTLGEATVQAKAAVSNADLRRTWMLFGDPTMVVNIR